MRETVSTIIPVFNTASYIKESVESAVFQGETIELYLIDDGSTDDSSVLCDELCQRDSRIIVAHKKNEGVAVARNAGLDLSSGEYISFLDSDDVFLPNTITQMVDCFTIYQPDIVIGHLIRSEQIPENGSTLFIEKTRICSQLIPWKIQNIDRVDDICFPSTGFSTCLYKRSIISRHSIKFPGIKIGEDIVFYLRYLSNCNSAYLSNINCYFYRSRIGSAIMSYRASFISDNDKYLAEIRDLLECCDIDKRVYNNVLRIAERNRVYAEVENEIHSDGTLWLLYKHYRTIRNKERYVENYTYKLINTFSLSFRILYYLLQGRLYFVAALYTRVWLKWRIRI